MTNEERRIYHHKGGKVSHVDGEFNPTDLMEGEEKIVKLTSGQMVKYFKFNGVLPYLTTKTLEFPSSS